MQPPSAPYVHYEPYGADYTLYPPNSENVDFKPYVVQSTPPRNFSLVIRHIFVFIGFLTGIVSAVCLGVVSGAISEGWTLPLGIAGYLIFVVSFGCTMCALRWKSPKVRDTKSTVYTLLEVFGITLGILVIVG